MSNCPDVELAPGDPRYPEDLVALGDHAPARLFARGRLDALETRPRIAIVGTRRATSYGLRVTRELTAAFVRAGACVVSGMAAGIDGMAHRTALDAGGDTIAVLGTGLGGVYPRAHRALQREIGERGLLLAELEPDDHGMPFTFLHRNRIIAALSSLVIVVEAPEKSGALNTAQHALDIGRDLGVVPNAIDQPQSAGSNALLATAHPITSVESALALAHLTPPPRSHRGSPDGDEGRIWKALSTGAMDIDTLCSRTGLPAAQCLGAVTRLELAGSIECELTGLIRRR